MFGYGLDRFLLARRLLMVYLVNNMGCSVWALVEDEQLCHRLRRGGGGEF